MHQFGTEVDYSLSKHQEEEELLKKTVALTCQNRTSKEQSKNCSGAGSTPEGRKYVTLKECFKVISNLNAVGVFLPFLQFSISHLMFAFLQKLLKQISQPQFCT